MSLNHSSSSEPDGPRPNKIRRLGISSTRYNRLVASSRDNNGLNNVEQEAEIKEEPGIDSTSLPTVSNLPPSKHNDKLEVGQAQSSSPSLPAKDRPKSVKKGTKSTDKGTRSLEELDEALDSYLAELEEKTRDNKTPTHDEIADVIQDLERIRITAGLAHKKVMDEQRKRHDDQTSSPAQPSEKRNNPPKSGRDERKKKL